MKRMISLFAALFGLLLISGCRGWAAPKDDTGVTTASPGQHSFHSEFHSNGGRTGVPFKFGFYAAVCPCNWTFDRVRLITGTLPPGLRIEGIQIVGVPERTGKWNCTVALEGFRCDCGAFQGPNFDYCRSGVILLFDIDR